MSSDSNYRRCLEILSHPDVDYRGLLYRIAVARPAALVYVVDGESSKRKKSEQEELINTCLSYLREGKKIDAIKHWRYVTHVGLKEAKDAVEALEWPKE